MLARPVLYLTHRVPYPPDKGDRIRNFHLLQQMVRGCPVWLACLADEPVTPEVETELRKLCERVEFVKVHPWLRWLRAVISLAFGRSFSEGAFSEPGLRRVIHDWTFETAFSAAVVSASSLAPYLRMKELAATPKIVDLVDVDSQKWLDYANASRGPKQWLYRLESRRVRKLERRLPEWTKARAVVSRAEADIYESYAGAATMTVAKNGVDLDYFAPQDVRTEQACAFVGAMDYLPNVDAAVWFAHEVWPAVRDRFPAAEYWIIGRKPTLAVQELAGLPGVKLVGQVPDIRPHLARAAIAVIPLRLARGIQNKVLEALAMGKPVIATPPALAALETIPGKHLLSATTRDEWVEAISRLFAEPVLREELGTAGRSYVEEHHHWDRCLAQLINAINPPTIETV